MVKFLFKLKREPIVRVATSTRLNKEGLIALLSVTSSNVQLLAEAFITSRNVQLVAEAFITSSNVQLVAEAFIY